MNTREIREIVYAFAIGDALGSVFEFQSPATEEIVDRFDNGSDLKFTDDTYLLLTTLSAYIELKALPENQQTWEKFHDLTCRALHAWYLTGDFRGIGDATYQALKQIDDYSYRHHSFTGFELHERGYNRKWSAGNGALSRYIPLLSFVSDLDKIPLSRWVQITHLHEDAIQSVRYLHEYVHGGITPPRLEGDEIRGFYCFETLQIAIDAVEQSKNLKEVLLASTIPEGDNDTIAALSFALWVIKNGYDELLPLESRVSQKDREILDDNLRGAFFQK